MEPAKLAALDLVWRHLTVYASTDDEGQSLSMMKQLHAHAPFEAQIPNCLRPAICDRLCIKLRRECFGGISSFTVYFTCKAVGRLSKARASLSWLELAHRHPAAEAWQAVVADPVLFGKAGGAMAGLLASHTHTLPAPCTHHFSALPTLKYSSAFLPAVRSRQLRGEQGAAARSSWPLRAATCEFCSTCISDGCADLLLGSGVWLAI